MTDIKQCWAYNKKGQRCEHPAGHPGDHVVGVQWTDEECATPTELAPPPPLPPLPPPVLVQEVVSCVACQHKHKGGACKCGCYEFVG
jgi:hypothetical protein